LDGESALCDGLGLFRRNDLEPGIVDVIDDAPHPGTDLHDAQTPTALNCCAAAILRYGPGADMCTATYVVEPPFRPLAKVM